MIKTKMGIAKKVTLIILMTTFFTGLIGCFLTFFDMEKFRIFVSVFTPMFSIMIISIGGNSLAEKLKGKKDVWKN